ncbi:MAG: FtsQ-type POTRA domain-containing protein [Gemmatimonadota bacterium]|nr:FtsQ-type POTRA domain-containing protein [Gemmatimonadota bacterium]
MSLATGRSERRVWRAVGALTAFSLMAAAPWWAPAALSELSYFRVRKIEVVGATFLSPADVYARMAVDTSTSVWVEVSELERRVAAHPQVREVDVERRLPGTLVVRVTENLPVALVPSPQGLRPYDEGGIELPIEPSWMDVDLPIVPRADTTIFRLLGEVRETQPGLFARISELKRRGRDELLIAIPPFLVRAAADITADRLGDILPVESDLSRRQARVAEIDLRFRDQVVARLQ